MKNGSSISGVFEVDLATCNGVGFSVPSPCVLRSFLHGGTALLLPHKPRHNLRLYTNYQHYFVNGPAVIAEATTDGRPFLPLNWDEEDVDCVAFSCSLKIDSPGFYEFRLSDGGSTNIMCRFYLYVTAGKEEKASLEAVAGSVIGEKSRPPLEGESVQTLIVKCMGQLDVWEKHWETAAKCGYTAVHLTPIQVNLSDGKLEMFTMKPRGISDSAYCICDQLDIEPRLFPPTINTVAQRFQKMADSLKVARNKYGLMPLVDVLLSHTAANTSWLYEHPDSAYSLNSAPYLKALGVFLCFSLVRVLLFLT